MNEPPKCTCNKHDEDGNLIVYIGEGKPCISCKEREPCFERYMKFIENRRIGISNDPLCPYCKISLHWEQFKEVWFCRQHGVFGDEMLDIPKKILPEKQFTEIDILESYAIWARNKTESEDEENMYYTRCEAWNGFEELLKQLRKDKKLAELRGIKEGWLK
jgi:hypothetical protein